MLPPPWLSLATKPQQRKLTKDLEAVPFVVALSAYESQLTGAADVVLPVTMWAEGSGSYLSMDGRLQKAIKSLEAPEGVITSLEALEKIAGVLKVQPDQDWKASLMAPNTHRPDPGSLNPAIKYWY